MLSFTTIEGSRWHLSGPGALVSVILWLANVAAEDVITLTSATLDKRLTSTSLTTLAMGAVKFFSTEIIRSYFGIRIPKKIYENLQQLCFCHFYFKDHANQITQSITQKRRQSFFVPRNFDQHLQDL